MYSKAVGVTKSSLHYVFYIKFENDGPEVDEL